MTAYLEERQLCYGVTYPCELYSGERKNLTYYGERFEDANGERLHWGDVRYVFSPVLKYQVEITHRLGRAKETVEQATRAIAGHMAGDRGRVTYTMVRVFINDVPVWQVYQTHKVGNVFTSYDDAEKFMAQEARGESCLNGSESIEDMAGGQVSVGQCTWKITVVT